MRPLTWHQTKPKAANQERANRLHAPATFRPVEPDAWTMAYPLILLLAAAIAWGVAIVAL